MWDVVVEAHELVSNTGVRYSIERLDYRTGGTESSDLACRWAVQQAHRLAGVPPWKPYVRESLKHTRVGRYMLQLV